MEILNEIEGSVNTVAVTVNPSNADLDNFSRMKFTHVQLHGNESLDEVRKIRENFDFKIIKSLSISAETDLTNIDNYYPYIDHILLDSKQKKDMQGELVCHLIGI